MNDNDIEDIERLAEMRELRFEKFGGPKPDCALIARSANTGIWQTDKTAVLDCPWHSPGSSAINRGFPVEKLEAVLETGLDVPPQEPFYAESGGTSKAWKYPVGRSTPALLVLNRNLAERSYATKPSDADKTWTPDRTIYPNEYPDGTTQVHTRFTKSLTGSAQDEQLYGFWIPGNARDALLAVVIGGPYSTVVQRLKTLHLSPSHSVTFVR